MKRIMKRVLAAFLCYFLGWGAALRMPGVVLLKWVVNVFFAAGAGLGIAIVLYRNFAHSAVTEDLMAEMAPDTLLEFFLSHQGQLEIAMMAAVPFAAVYFAINLFLTGGILEALHARQRLPWGDFFQACGRHFLRLVAVAVVSGILFIIAAGLPYFLFSKLYEPFTNNATTSTLSFYYTWVWWLFVLLFASWGLRIYDYARMALFVEPNRNLFSCFYRAARFVTHRFISTFALWLALILTPLIFVYGYFEATGYFGVDTLWGAILAFALGQVLVMLRIAAAIARLAGQMRYYQAVAPQPVPFEVDLIADPVQEDTYRMGGI